MPKDSDHAALMRIHDTLAGSAEALSAFIDCAENGIPPPESLIEAAHGFIEELLRYVEGSRLN